MAIKLKSDLLTLAPKPQRGPEAPTEAKEDSSERGPFSFLQDLYIGTRYVTTGLTYRHLSKLQKQDFQSEEWLKEKPNVKLERPFVMVPGWNTIIEQFQPLGDKLTADGQNGGEIVFVQNGMFYTDRACFHAYESPVDNKNKVFEVVFSDRRNPPDQNATELAKNLQSIQDVTGAPKLDVNAYSMGGVVTRIYLDRLAEKKESPVGKLLFLGSPNKGTDFARMAKECLKRDIQWAISLGGLKITDLPALEWMTPGNPKLNDLNSRVPEQLTRVEQSLAIAGDDYPTPSGSVGFSWGDGLVTRDSVLLEGVDKVLLEENEHHSHLNYNPEVYDKLIEYYGWSQSELS